MLQKIRRNISNLPGWRTSRKFVVIESDDWGSARMPSREAFGRLMKFGIVPRHQDQERYLKYDGLATASDLSFLFEVLEARKDRNGRTAVFTPLAIMANPDFEKIEAHGFESYFYEPFTRSLEREPSHQDAFQLWQQGISRGLFNPQLHGREHLNVAAWMNALRSGNKDTRFAFNQHVYGFTPREPVSPVNYQDAFDLDRLDEVDQQESILMEAVDLFEQLLSYKPTYFVPPGGPFNSRMETALDRCGISGIGAAKIQREPLGNGKTRTRMHFLGQRNRYGQTYVTRNCIFEPSSTIESDWVDSCLNDIHIAFRWNKPAVISSHRVNYIGTLHLSNRDRGLKQLEVLLDLIIKRWPEVEFLTSEELTSIINKKRTVENSPAHSQ